ncbi:MAG: histidine phosphatase family protein [Pseudomonadota bacterium]|jgi:phosphohistidine phosphatase SixA|nr:histidine phosphatase family protein [Curvibacter sp.]
MMRHADAPGVGDPPGFRLGDCSTQRNLGAAGREQARAVGRWLRAHGLMQARVWASPWCRCMETAQLLGYGAVQTDDSLASFFGESQQAAARTVALQGLIARLLVQPGAPLPLLVTHQVNLSAYAGGFAASAELLLVRVDSAGRPLNVQRHAPPPTS